MAIYVTGDTHGDMEIDRLSFKNWPVGKTLSRTDVVVILGDFWFGPGRTKSDDFWLDWLEDKPWTTLVVDGNHENFPILNSLPDGQAFGNTVGIIRPHVLHLRRGLIYDICGYRCLAIGGADSIDVAYRTKGVNWWPEESITHEDISRAEQSLELHGYNIDYVFSHTGPTAIVKRALHAAYGVDIDAPLLFDASSLQLDTLVPKLKFKRWFMGHLHTDSMFFDVNYYVLWKSIIKADFQI
ncbi:metallophosphoesterase [Methanosarcina lacustris]|nr:metallophosphoesterase [Methanosarcina lacustris]